MLGADTTDFIVEFADDGIDTFTSTVTRSLASYFAVERLTLLGTANANATGNDVANILTGNDGHNTLNGGLGADLLFGGLGNDTYQLGAESDGVSDTGGVDTINSTITRSLAGYVHVERLLLQGTADLNGTGNGLNNTLFGNDGKNTLNGGIGADTLIGGRGRDVLTGGAGNDIFDFNAVNETGTNASTRDTITDFVKGQDKIDLSTIDSNAESPGDISFVFIGATGFDDVAGQVRYYQQDNVDNALDQTIVEGNVDGNGSPNFAIRLTGLINLAAADFNL